MGVALEVAALAGALAYVVLAIRRSVWCWPFAIMSAVLYLQVFAASGLLTQAALQVFYVAVALRGWWLWSRSAEDLAIVRWPLAAHGLLLIAVALLVAVTFQLLPDEEPAWTRWLDAATACAAVAATWLVAHRVLENWHWWLVIDAVSAALFAARGLWLTAALFAGYFGLALLGLGTWRRAWQRANS